MDSTRAPLDIAAPVSRLHQLPLFEVLLNCCRLLAEKLYVGMRILKKSADRFEGPLKSFGKLPLFLIPPRSFQPAQLAMQTAHQTLNFIVESIEILGKPS